MLEKKIALLLENEFALKGSVCKIAPLSVTEFARHRKHQKPTRKTSRTGNRLTSRIKLLFEESNKSEASARYQISHSDLNKKIKIMVKIANDFGTCKPDLFFGFL